MHKLHQFLCFILIIGAAFSPPKSAKAATEWPADNGMEIGRQGETAGLPEGFEPSGAIWHPGRQTLIVVDDSGLVSELDPVQGVLAIWELDEDLEGVTIADANGALVYLAIEDPDGVLEFSLDTGTPTGNHWDLTPWLDGPDNRGLEALTWVEGYFYAGLQADGNIFVFDLVPGGAAQYQRTILPHEGRDDISGLHYDHCTGTLYAIHDSHDVIVEMTAAGNFLREYELAGEKQEGVAVVGESTSGQTTIFIAQDSGDVWMYEEYTIDPCEMTSGALDFPVLPAIPLECSPNPFNPSTDISFELQQSEHVSLRIFNTAGQCLCTLIDSEWAAGHHRISWHGKNDAGQTLASGVYFACLATGTSARTVKLVLAK